MYSKKVVKAVKILTEYFILRGKYRRVDFKGFDVTLHDNQLHLLSLDTEIIFLKRLGVKNYKYQVSDKRQYTIVVYEVKTLDVNGCKNINVDFFSLDELQYNIFTNFMSPKLHFLSYEKELEIKNYYGLKLPILFKSDKMCRYLGCKKDDLICFRRKRDDSLYIRIID